MRVQLSGGGLDSTAMMILDWDHIDKVVFAEYGQRSREGELHSVCRVIGALHSVMLEKEKPDRSPDFVTGKIIDQRLAENNPDNKLFVPGGTDDFIYGRNATLLIDIANAFFGQLAPGENLTLLMGLCHESMMFPDADADFINLMDQVLDRSFAGRVHVEAPYINTPKQVFMQNALSKLETRGLGSEVLWDSFTCWTPNSEGQQCGICYHCSKAKKLRAIIEG